LDQHVRADWSDVRKRLCESAAAAGVDEEALATYDEALQAHEAGLYRSVVRLLFPEIERLAREKVYGGDRREAPSGRRTKGTLNTGLKDFREAVWSKLPAGVAANTKYGITLAHKMYEHLYKWVGESDENVAEFRDDPVPNRHASQHGYVVYSTHQNSMNMLAMADFMFHLIMRTNAHLVRAAKEKQAKENGDEQAA
jgi:hypothetical protein